MGGGVAGDRGVTWGHVVVNLADRVQLSERQQGAEREPQSADDREGGAFRVWDKGGWRVRNKPRECEKQTPRTPI